MTRINEIFQLLENIAGQPWLRIAIISIALLLKSYILVKVLAQKNSLATFRRSYALLILVLISAIAEDITWLLKISHSSFFPFISYKLIVSLIRIAWAFATMRDIYLALFLETLLAPYKALNQRQKLLFGISGLCAIGFLTLATLYYNFTDKELRPLWEFRLMEYSTIYSLFFLLLPIVILVVYKISTKQYPRILQKQVKLLISILVVPLIASETLQLYPFHFYGEYIVSSNIFASMTTILITALIYSCASKMKALRFLNISKCIESSNQFNFIDNFKDTLEKLGYATSMQELTHITQELFQKAFDIPARATKLHVRYQPNTLSNVIQQQSSVFSAIDIISNNTPDNQLLDDIKQSKILIYDEIAFSNFYDHNRGSQHIIQFLNDIFADIFIPIHNNQKIIGCIIIERNARPSNLYSNIECDEMMVFASYLGNIIYLLQSRNLEYLIAQEKEMREELYSKCQEINQYKESIRSFLKNSKHKKIGIIFYKSRQFILGNREAKDLIPVNLNMHDGHPLTKACKQIVSEVQQYKSAQMCLINNSNGSKIAISGVPALENNNVTLIVYHPEASALITQQIDLLKDPSQWDYVLYLETTETGKLINQLIPSSGENILQFKIELLKTALSTKATLIDMPSEDLMPIVELLHHISLRTNLHTICLEAPQTKPDLTIKLFGINPLFGIKQDIPEPILKKLDGNGTLFIQNIHFLDHETQEYLAEFIQYGFFRIYKSDQKIFSNVRIIVSSSQPLDILANEDAFSPKLLKELKKASLTMPPLINFSEQEIETLTEGFAEQALSDRTFEKLLVLSERDRKRIINSCPTSLQELKKRVQALLTQKSRANNIYTETTFDPAYQISDPELAEIARFGRYALKDEKAMTILWNKFRNQNKIATFLGVNRSSVNLLCKRYKLQ